MMNSYEAIGIYIYGCVDFRQGRVAAKTVLFRRVYNARELSEVADVNS